tara:strand:- start:18649 stop:19728 length:1080 start_codon:yes stop_codon:yes gene_type:complete
MELVKTFNNTLNDFMRNLIKCYPNETKQLYVITELNDTRPLQRFMKSIGNNITKISNKDESLFSESLNCIDGCDLSQIWNLDSSNKTNHDAIWKFLQTLSLIGTTVRSKSSNLEQFFDQLDNDKLFDNMNLNEIQGDMFNIVQKLMEENNSVDLDEDEEKCSEEEGNDNPHESFDPTEEYTKMFKDTKIGDLAKEIAEDIDVSSTFKDLENMDSPDISTIMNKLVGGGGLQQLVKSVADKVKNKMESGELNQDELVGEVNDMMEKMKKDKKFKKMFKSKDVQGIFKEMMKQKGQTMNEDDDDFSALEELCSAAKNNAKKGFPQMPPQSFRGGSRRNAARNRLRKKLQASKENNEGDVNP